jgi:asparagine synthase (glutamine-hydrolysing)
MLLDQHYYLPDNILYKVDRMSMAHSVEVRPPLLDHRIVEFAARLPERLKLRGATGKYLLKETLRGKLPNSVIDRRKSGFDIPAHAWFRGILKPLLYETLSRSAIESTGIFEFAATERLIRDHMSERVNAGYQLWGLLTLFLWLKKWRIQIPPTQPQEVLADSLAATT